MIRFLIVISILTTFISCSRMSNVTSHEDMLDHIRRAGIIEACTVVEPPFVIKDGKTGALSGVYIDAMNLIAQKMNAKVNWHETTFGNATADLSSNRCDVNVAASYALIPRAEVISFIEPPLNYQGLSAIVRKDDKNAIKAKNIFAFDRPGVTVAINTGSAVDVFITEHFKKATLRRIDVQPSDPARHLVEVSANRADIAIYTTDECERYAREHPEVTVILRKPPIALYPVNWAVRQDDMKWRHFLETALQFLDTQDTIAQFEKKYHAHLIRLVKQYKLQ